MSLTSADISYIEHCQFKEWYKLFKKLTPNSRVLDCPQQFKDWLLADGIVLPIDSEGEQEEQEDEADSSDSEGVAGPVIPSEFNKKVKQTIKELGGAVAPKLNWSAPKDAVWMSATNDMKCLNADDVYMLIKSSDYCTFDLTQAYGNHGPTDLTLVLREWFDIFPSLEFRCFVKDGHLIAVTQRDMNYYDFLAPMRGKILSLIEAFIPKLDAFPDPSFVADVYIPKSQDKVWLIDINPFLDRTDTLLIDWDELKACEPSKTPELRLVDKVDSTRGFGAKEHTTNYVPHDLIDIPRENLDELVAEMKKHDVQIKLDLEKPQDPIPTPVTEIPASSKHETGPVANDDEKS